MKQTLNKSASTGLSVFAQPIERYYLSLNLHLKNLGLLSGQKPDLYGAGGPDVAAPLLVLNSQKLVIVDLANFNLCQFSTLADGRLSLSNLQSKDSITGVANNFSLGFWNSIHTINFGLPLFTTLKKMGASKIKLVTPNAINPRLLEDLDLKESSVKAVIAFEWKHPNDTKALPREITIWSKTPIESAIKSDQLLPNRIRAYFEKAAILDGRQQAFLEDPNFRRRLSAKDSFAVVSQRYEHPPARFTTYIEQTETPYSKACASDILLSSPFGCKDGYGWKMRILKPAWEETELRSLRVSGASHPQ